MIMVALLLRVLFIFAVIWFTKRLFAKLLKTNKSSPSDDPFKAGSREPHASPPKDPYSILQVDPTMSPEQIRKSYLNLIKQYHPDKVKHLGIDLQKLAQKKSEEINWAYQQLQRPKS
jgi:DnaJ-domain-containing protein 1